MSRAHVLARLGRVQQSPLEFQFSALLAEANVG
jgi:hypothetical protein